MREYFDLFMNDAEVFVTAVLGGIALGLTGILFLIIAKSIANSGKDDDY